jgi:hypothetical protein
MFNQGQNQSASADFKERGYVKASRLLPIAKRGLVWAKQQS